MLPTSLLFTLLLALVVSATPVVQVARGPVTLPIARKLNLTNVRSLYEHDLARAQNLKTRGSDKSKRAVISTSATNEVVTYYATVGVGSPATNCTHLDLRTHFPALTVIVPSFSKLDQLLIDTGRQATFNPANIICQQVHPLAPTPGSVLERPMS